MTDLNNVNPCPATPGYIRFQADSKPNNMSLIMDNVVCGSVSYTNSGFSYTNTDNV